MKFVKEKAQSKGKSGGRGAGADANVPPPPDISGAGGDQTLADARAKAKAKAKAKGQGGKNLKDILCRHLRDNAKWGNCPLGGEACPYSHKPEKFGLSSALRQQNHPKAEPKPKAARKRGTPASGQEQGGAEWDLAAGAP